MAITECLFVLSTSNVGGTNFCVLAFPKSSKSILSKRKNEKTKNFVEQNIKTKESRCAKRSALVNECKLNVYLFVCSSKRLVVVYPMKDVNDPLI